MKLIPALAVVALVAVSFHGATAPRVTSDPPGSKPPIRLPATLPDPDAACATGCAAAPGPELGLSPREFLDLLDEYMDTESDAPSLALETLLFHGEHTLARIDEEGLDLLDEEHAEFLERELSRDSAYLEVRLVGEDGGERLHLNPTLVPLGVKQHLFAEQNGGLQPPEISGTVRRVGLEHLWVRL